MSRRLLSLSAVAVLCATIGAQGPNTLNSTQRSVLYKKNRAVIESLVEKTVESSRTPNDHLKRADSYYKVLFDFSKEISAAREANDPDRVAELTAHLKQLLDDGLTPTLADARLQVEGGTGGQDYERVRDGLIAQVDVLLNVISDQPETKKSLDGARSRLQTITGPKKK